MPTETIATVFRSLQMNFRTIPRRALFNSYFFPYSSKYPSPLLNGFLPSLMTKLQFASGPELNNILTKGPGPFAETFAKDLAEAGIFSAISSRLAALPVKDVNVANRVFGYTALDGLQNQGHLGIGASSAYVLGDVSARQLLPGMFLNFPNGSAILSSGNATPEEVAQMLTTATPEQLAQMLSDNEPTGVARMLDATARGASLKGLHIVLSNGNIVRNLHHSLLQIGPWSIELMVMRANERFHILRGE